MTVSTACFHISMLLTITFLLKMAKSQYYQQMVSHNNVDHTMDDSLEIDRESELVSTHSINIDESPNELELSQS